jgi:hypothetical protein
MKNFLSSANGRSSGGSPRLVFPFRTKPAEVWRSPRRQKAFGASEGCASFWTAAMASDAFAALEHPTRSTLLPRPAHIPEKR